MEMATAIKTDHPHVVRVPGVLGGQPIVDGFRVSVASVARFLNSGTSPEEIIATYPHVGAAAIYDAISYYLDHRTEIDQLIAESTPEALQEHYGFTVGEKGRVIFKDR